MNNYKINYDKLQNIHIKHFPWALIILLLSAIFIIVSNYVYIFHTITTFGVIDKDGLHIKINVKLSDAVKSSGNLSFNNRKLDYKIKEFGDFEIIDNEVFQNITLTVDQTLYDNEFGNIKIYYRKEKILNYFLELFK